MALTAGNSALLGSAIRMLNQIADNLRSSGSDADAAQLVAQHLQRFWARSMKKQIVEYAERDGSELNAIARLAVISLIAK